jgi:hypothetical protein
MSQPTIRPTDVARTLKKHPWQIVAPVVVFALLALAYAEVRPTTWEASQALVVRDEAGDRLTRPGKFTLADEMKNSQETILALARSRSVLSAALAEVGPPAGHETTSAWPSELEIEDLQIEGEDYSAQGRGIRKDGSLLSEGSGREPAARGSFEAGHLWAIAKLLREPARGKSSRHD